MSMGLYGWACLLLTAGAVPPEPCYLNQRSFQIPIRVQPERKDDIKGLELYVSLDNGQSWQASARALPDQAAFNYAAARDGHYLFTVVVLDKKTGLPEPRDVMTAPIGQHIVVDTIKPDVRLLKAERQAEEIVVKWSAHEENPDWATLNLEYRPADAPDSVWVRVGVLPGETGETKVPARGPGAVALRLTLKDKAENVGVAETTVPAAAGAAATAAGGQTAAPWGGSGVQPTTLSTSGAPAGSGGPPDNLPPPPREQSPPPGLGGPSSTGSAIGTSTTPGAFPGGAPPAGGERGKLPALRIVNKPQVKLDFDVSRFGPSGLGGVDVYVTQDEGANWEKAQGDVAPTLASPPEAGRPGPVHGSLSLPLPREGVVYGFYLVVKSKAGLGKAPPQRGDLPHIRVERDTKLPDAKLYGPELDPTNPGCLVMIWQAADKNLTDKPVSLEWAERREGPWDFIGEPQLANTGRYSWKVPEHAPAKVYLRLSVRDQAGNVAVAQTNEPILIDLVVPELEKVDVSVNSR
jgi:hypothetical protein